MSALVLVVDDNAATRKLVRVALEGASYQVALEEDGGGALRFVERTTPQLVLCDLLLPDLSGLEVAEALRARLGPELPILAFSGFLPQVDESRLLSSAFTDYLIKPVSPRLLLESVAQHLQAKAPPPSPGKRLLIVDDDPSQLRMVSIRLKTLGYQVETARSAELALEMARRSAPDLVVSDVLMPGIDGFDLCRQLRSDPTFQETRVLLTSNSYVEKEDRQLALRLGASGYVTRSEGFGQLETAIAECLVRVPPVPALSLGVGQQHFSRVVRQLERQVDAQRGLTRRLALQTAELAILGDMAEALVRHQNLEAALDDVLTSCLDAGGISLGALYLPDGRGGLNVHSYGTANWDQELRLEHPHLLDRILQGTVPVLLPAGFEGERELLASSGLVSLLVMPLVFGEGPRGALLMASRGARFEGDWQAFARSLGLQIEQSLRLSRAFQEVEESRAEARRQAGVLESVVESMADGVVVWDVDGRPTLTNAVGAVVLPELAGAEARGLDGLEVTLPDGRVMAATARPCEDGTVTVWRDVTVRREQMVADRLASMGMLAAGVAHEISNPLTAMNYFLELLALREGPSEELLQGALEAAGQVARLVTDLRLIAQPQEELTLVQLAGVLQSAVRLAAAEIRRRAEIVLELKPVSDVRANASRLVQVFLNLLINAAHSFPEESPASRNRIHVSLGQGADGRVAAAVSDNGVGISPEQLESVFQPFYTTKPSTRGTGLGLPISQRIVAGLRGELKLTSEPGQGTTATVLLPPAT